MTRPQTLVVSEMYSSIQGESTWAGLPCFFVRLTGCPLRCRWCDTTHAFDGGERMAIAEIVRAVVDSGIPMVEVTGGEPLAQRNCPHLCRALLDAGLTVLVETAGSHPIGILPGGVHRIMDLKCPDSGESASNLWSNLEHLNRNDEVKLVIASRGDFEWASEVVRKHQLDQKASAVLFSPVLGEVEPADLVAWILNDKLPVRFQLQLHKVVWAPDQKGV